MLAGDLAPRGSPLRQRGGYGYTRDFPVEQYWRDSRLNMIHEGTHGIQAMDLLRPATRGKLAAATYFFRYERPKVQGWLPVVERCDQTCAELTEDAF